MASVEKQMAKLPTGRNELIFCGKLFKNCYKWLPPSHP